MPEPRWTRPPWTRAGRQVRGRHGLHLARVYHVLSAEETEANLCLMSLAPELYEALEGMVDCLDPDDEWPDGMLEACERAEAVMARARGERADHG